MLPTRRPWLRRSLAIGAIGLVIAILGIVYGVFLVGVPSQDLSPELARQESLHSAVSGWLAGIGLCLMLLGILGFFSVLITRSISRITA